MYRKVFCKEDQMSLVIQNSESNTREPDWQGAAGMVLTSLEAGSWRENQREQLRSAYRVKAALRLFAEPPPAPARILYTRDVDHRGIGFVTRDRLPLGYGGIIRLPSNRTPGKIINIPCTLYRCREAAPGWYEGALHFNRDQMDFLNSEFDLPVPK
jgi:hypothetical protein